MIYKTLPPKLTNHANLKEVLRSLGFEYTNYHCCPKSCAIYYCKLENDVVCHVCGTTCYKDNTKGKSSPQKVYILAFHLQ